MMDPYIDYPVVTQEPDLRLEQYKETHLPNRRVSHKRPLNPKITKVTYTASLWFAISCVPVLLPVLVGMALGDWRAGLDWGGAILGVFEIFMSYVVACFAYNMINDPKDKYSRSNDKAESDAFRAMISAILIVFIGICFGLVIFSLALRLSGDLR